MLTLIIDSETMYRILMSYREHGKARCFSVTWKRRTTSKDGLRKKGDHQKMTARFGVRKHLKGGGPAYDRAKKRMVCVYQFAGQKGSERGYKSIHIDDIVQARINGVTFIVAAESPIQQ